MCVASNVESMSTNSDSDTSSVTTRRRQLLQYSAVTIMSGVALTGSSMPAAAQNDTNQTDVESSTEDSTDDNEEEDSVTEDESDGEESTCDGAPGMSRTSVTTVNSKITSEDPAVVEANFRPEPSIPEECTIMVDLEFSFTDAGFQWGGGANWDQSTTDLLVGTFEVRPGEIRDIRGELHTQGAEAGDSVTVIADYELWFKGNREDSVQQSGIRHTIDVEEPNPPEDEESDVSVTGDVTPGFGIASSLAGIGGAGYMLKSKLTDNTE